MSSGAWIRYTASAAGVRGRDPAFADAACAAVQPAQPVALIGDVGDEIGARLAV